MPNFDAATVTDQPDGPTHCKRGHPRTPDNIYVNSKGDRVCKTCFYAAIKRWRDRNPFTPEERERQRAHKKAWRQRNPDYQREYRARKAQA